MDYPTMYGWAVSASAAYVCVARRMPRMAKVEYPPEHVSDVRGFVLRDFYEKQVWLCTKGQEGP